MITTALKAAKTSDMRKTRVGCVITKGRRVIATGVNQMRHISRCPTPLKWQASCHAETAAVMKLLRTRRQHLLVGSTIKVTRVKRDGKIGMAKPCPSCHALLLACGVKKAIYTTETGIGEIRF